MDVTWPPGRGLGLPAAGSSTGDRPWWDLVAVLFQAAEDPDDVDLLALQLAGACKDCVQPWPCGPLHARASREKQLDHVRMAAPRR